MNRYAADLELIARRIECETVRAVLRVLEDGANLHEGGQLGAIVDDEQGRLRALRTQLLERDVYELLYDALPVGIVDPANMYHCDPITGEPDQSSPHPVEPGPGQDRFKWELSLD